MTNRTISEKCETFYNKLNSFVTSVINRDVTPKISNLNTEVWGSNTQTGDSRIYLLEHSTEALRGSVNSLSTSITNILQYKQVATFQSNKIKVFANSFSGCILINGTFTVTANGTTTLCTIPSQYKPPNAITLPCNDSQTVHNYISIWNSSGDLNLRNRGSGTSVSAYNIVYYPLQSRMP